MQLCTANTIEDLASATRRRTPICSKRVGFSAAVGVLATLVASSYSAYRIRESEKDFNAIQRSQVKSAGQQLLSGVQRQLETSVSSTKALSALIHLDQAEKLLEPLSGLVHNLVNKSAVLSTLEDPTAEQKALAEQEKALAQQAVVANSSLFEFNTVAASLISTYKGISNLQLAPGGIVSAIYPLASNEGAVGHDLFYDPNRRQAAMETIRQGSVVFIGPVVLIQNRKRAIIARNPTFIDRGGFVGPVGEHPSWWGFATMLCTLDDLFEATPLARAEEYDMSYLLVAQTGNGKQFLSASGSVLRGAENIDNDDATWLAHVDKYDPVELSFVLPELRVHWVMKVWPREGWREHSDTFLLQVLLCSFFTVCSLVSMYSVLVRESVITQVAEILSRQSRPQKTGWEADKVVPAPDGPPSNMRVLEPHLV